jgi:hypothetical protein
MGSPHAPFPESSALDQSQLFPSRPPNVAPQSQTTGRSRRTKLVDHLPGLPNIPLHRPTVLRTIYQELSTPILEELYPHLWMVGRRFYSNIDPLHRQAIKGRKLLLSEDAQLHLLWQDDMIYIKPVPTWLLNYQVWQQFLPPSPQQTTGSPVGQQGKGQVCLSTASESTARKAALGFLRSYTYLIQHQSDFIIAHQHHLIPSNINWAAWSRFSACFRDTKDVDVTNRYHYGQLRLSRLHWAVRLFRPRTASTAWFYYLPHWSTAPFIHSILAPLAFALATLSLVLSAMQILVNLPADDLGFAGASERGLEKMRRAFWTFSISVTITSSVIWILIIIIPLGILISQLWWGFVHREKAVKSCSTTMAGA